MKDEKLSIDLQISYNDKSNFSKRYTSIWMQESDHRITYTNDDQHDTTIDESNTHIV